MATKRINVEIVQNKLLALNIQYLGDYNNTRKAFSCRCNACGHHWNAFWSNVIRKGCPACSRKTAALKQQRPLPVVLKKLKDKHISLLSAYCGVAAKHELECACGYRWTAVLCDVLRKTGCPACAPKLAAQRRRLPEATVIQRLKTRQIDLLTPYKGAHHKNKYRARCLKCSYEWQATYATLSYHGCPRCGGVLPKTLADYQKLAAGYGGSCLRQGKNTMHKSLWECAEGHHFQKAYSSLVQTESFCPICQNSRAEEVCRLAFETMFQKPFPKVRFKMDGYSHPLELDGYNAELKLAFEHQGAQHYRPSWHPDAVAKYRKTVRNDQRKVNWCRTNDVQLVCIPELYCKTALCDLETFIRSNVNNCAEIKAKLDIAQLKQMPSPVAKEGRQRHQRLATAAAVNNLQLLDDKFKGTLEDYRLVCGEKHIFSAHYKSIIRGVRCPKCRKLQRNSRQSASIGIAHQRLIRDRYATEDAQRLQRLNLTPQRASTFTLAQETLTGEHRDFIERYEWLGNAGYGIKWCFTARYAGLLGGVVLLSEPYRFERQETREMECLIQRGACASWTPINLGSRLIGFACGHMTRHADKRIFFAYADPAAGEIGTIYQACNFIFLGMIPKTVYTHRGEVKSAQTIKRTRRLLPWLKQQNIHLPSTCFTERGYFKWSKIPLAIRARMRAHVRTQVNHWNRQDLTHGKYVLIKGKSKTQTRKLLQVYAFKAQPYPKRLSSIV